MKNIVISNGYTLWKYLFSDVQKTGGSIHHYPFNDYHTHRFEYYIYRVFNSRFAPPFLHKIWYKHVLKKWGIPPHTQANILFLNPSLSLLDQKFLLYLISQSALQISLLFIDTVSCLGEAEFQRMSPSLSHFKSIYTYDQQDALQYHWEHTYKYYSKLPLKDTFPMCDVFLILYNKGRVYKALELYDYLESRNISCHFIINGVSDEIILNNARSGVVYNHTLEYPDIIHHIASSKVIVELCQDGQSSNTLRVFEAVCYNKKLITNNPSIKDFPFFNSEYIKLFLNLSDLDAIPNSFFKHNEPIDYHYRNQYSPNLFFDELSK